MYVITGATGNTGSVVADALLARGQKVRVIGRDAGKLQRFVARGAEAFVGDVGDAEAMTGAFTGAKAVYAMIPPSYAGDFRANQDAVGTALAAAMERAGVTHVVCLSSVGAHLPERAGPISGLHHFEQKLNRIAKANVLHLRPTYFMENLLTLIPAIKQYGVLASDFRPDLQMAMIATRDIGARAAEELLKLSFTGKSTRELLGPREYTFDEIARILGAAIGNASLVYTQVPYEQVEQALIGVGLSAATAQLLSEMTRGFNDGYIRPLERRSAANTTPTAMETFAGEVFAPAFSGKAAGA